MNTRLNTLTLPLRVSHSRILLALALGLASFTTKAFAQDDCQLQLSAQTIDFGEFERKKPTHAEQHSGLMPVGTRPLSLSASCGEPAAVGLSFKGVRAGDDGYRFAKNGRFTLKVVDARLDGKPVTLHSLTTGESLGAHPMIRPGDEVAAYEGAQLAKGQHLSLQIEVDTIIDIAGTRVSADEEWNGTGDFFDTPPAVILGQPSASTMDHSVS